MAGFGNAATTVPCALSDLEEKYRNVLTDALALIHEPGDFLPDLTKIQVSKTNIPVDDPRTYLVGEVHSFLSKRSSNLYEKHDKPSRKFYSVEV